MTDTPSHVRVVDFAPPPLMNDATKAEVIDLLREIISEIENNEVSGIVCVIGYGMKGTRAFRGGTQDCEIVGRLEQYKNKIVVELT